MNDRGHRTTNETLVGDPKHLQIIIKITCSMLFGLTIFGVFYMCVFRLPVTDKMNEWMNRIFEKVFHIPVTIQLFHTFLDFIVWVDVWR